MMENVREYPPVVRFEENDGKRYFRTTFKEFPNLIGGIGETVSSSIENAYEMLEAEIEFRKEMGLSIPKPMVFDLASEPSGRVTLRMSKTQHAQLIQAAEEEGVSINSFINEAITVRLSFAIYARSSYVSNIIADHSDSFAATKLGMTQASQAKSTSDLVTFEAQPAQA